MNLVVEAPIDGHELGVVGPVYRAGQVVPAGRYTRVDRWGQIVILRDPDRLPASFDGTVALYRPLPVLTAASGTRS